MVGWLIGAIIGSSLALSVDSLVFHPVWKAAAPGEGQSVDKAAQGQNNAQPTLPPVGSKEPALRSTLPPIPAPMPMPNPVRHETIRKLRVIGIQPTAESLAEAVLKDSTRAVDLILKAGIAADAVDASGKPALLIACNRGCLPMVHQLLEAGANPNACNTKTGDGFSPLMAAAQRADIPIMECLLQHCAEIDAPDANGHTALHYAVFARQAAAVRWLINQGAPVVGECCHGAGTLHQHAVETWDGAIIGPVLQRERRSHTVLWDRASRNTLYAALHIQDKTMLRLLLANHDVPPTPQGYQQPLLAYLILWNYPNAFRLLLDCGADPNTAIGSPVEKSFSKLAPDDACRFYLEKEPGMTVLMLAAGLGRMDFVQALLEHGAKRGIVSRHYKMCAIQFAARAHQPEIIQLLLGKSPRPEDQHTRIDISLGRQQAVLWKDERVVLKVPISTGRTGFPTPSGRFVVTDKEPNRYSSIYKVSMPFFMRLSCSEFGMHAGVVPNYPASHGCIRLPPSAAVSFYRNVDLGTLVTILP